MKRGEWYTRHFGGQWRTARTERRCDCVTHGLRCRNVIAIGNQYFDTNVAKPKQDNPHVKLKLCASCATEELKK